jgi:hypothetical protein
MLVKAECAQLFLAVGRSRAAGAKNLLHRPAIELHRPAIELHRPAIELHRPAIELHRPAIELHRPAIELHRPAIELHRPAIELHRPAIELPQFQGDRSDCSIIKSGNVSYLCGNCYNRM